MRPLNDGLKNVAFEALGVKLEVQGFQSFNSQMKEVKNSIGDISATSSGGISVLSLLSTGITAVATAAVAAGTAIVTGLVASLTLAVKEAADAQKIWTQLGAAIISSGSSITTDLAKQLAMSFRDLAGGSDEAVASIIEMGMRMGVSDDQMESFIQNTLDLAAATGKDYPDAAKLMALFTEDVDSAITQARRSGILFTDELKDQIKAELKAGNKTKAMTLVMNRFSQAVGGRAVAASKDFWTQLSIIKNHIGEVFEEIGMKLLPILSPLLEKFMELVDRVGPQVVDFFSNNIVPVIQNAVDSIRMILAGDVIGGLENFGVPQAVIDTWNWLKESFNGVWNAIQLYLLPVFDKIYAWWQTNGKSITDAAGNLASAFGELAREAIVTAIKTIGEWLQKGFQWIVDNKDAILKFVNDFAQWVKDNKTAIITFFTWWAVLNMTGDLIPKTVEFLYTCISKAPLASAALAGVGGGLAIMAGVNLTPTGDELERISQAVRGTDLSPWETFIINLKSAADSARIISLIPINIFDQITGLDFTGGANKMIDDIGNAFSTGDWTPIKNQLERGFINIFDDVFGTEIASGLAEGIFSGSWQGLEDAQSANRDKFAAIGTSISNAISEGWSSVTDWFQKGANTCADIISGIGSNLRGLYDKGVELIRNVIAGFVAIAGDWWNKGRNIVDQIASGIVSLDLWQKGVNMVQRVLDGIGAIVGNLWNTGRNIVDRVVSGVTSIDLWNAGYNMVLSLGRGISYLWDWVTTLAKNVALGIYNAVIRGLKGGSPMKLMIDVGENIITSMGMGIMNETQGILDQMRDVSSGIMSASMVAAPMQSSTSNVTNNWNYSPTYGATPSNPEFDFSLMQARSLA